MPVVKEEVAKPPGEEPVRQHLITDDDPGPRQPLVRRQVCWLARRHEVDHLNARHVRQLGGPPGRVRSEADSSHTRNGRDEVDNCADATVERILWPIPVSDQWLDVEHQRAGRELSEQARQVAQIPEPLVTGTHQATGSGGKRELP